MNARRELPEPETAATGRDFGRRIALLAACLAAGCTVGAAWHWMSGDALWYVAIPLVLVVAWWFVADPTQCCGAGHS